MPKKKIDREALQFELDYLKRTNQAPERMNLEAYATMQPGLWVSEETNHKETPYEMMWRAACASAEGLPKHPGIEYDFYEAFKRQYLGNPTPTVANLGTKTKALPISCFVNVVEDSVDGIFSALHEAAMLTKVGGGVGIGMQNIREQASFITGGGKSNGAVPWGSIYDRASIIVSQAGVRRGAFKFSFNIRSADLWDWLLSKDHSKGDPTTHIHTNILTIIEDDFMDDVYNNDDDAVKRWDATQKTRIKSGSPLILFIDNARRLLPQWMKDAGLDVTGTNICTEIISCATYTRTMVCCLVSENLALYDEWKDWRSPKYGFNVHMLAAMYLDGVMEYFIKHSKGIPGLHKARMYAKLGRPLGVGVFGFGAYLQSKMIPFESKEAEEFNLRFFKEFHENLHAASEYMGAAYGYAKWAETGKRRNIQMSAIAPTVGNSVMAGGVTPGIEPLAANYFQADGSAGSWIRINPYLIKYLEDRQYNQSKIDDIIDSIIDNGGSVQHFDDDTIDPHAKLVFKRFDEIDQRHVVKLAIQRQPCIEQAQSLNVAFLPDADSDYINDVHLMAYEGGLPTLYYLRCDSIGKMSLRGDVTRDVNLEGPHDNYDLPDPGEMKRYIIITKEGCSFCEKAIEIMKENNFRYTTLSNENDDWYAYLESRASQEYADDIYELPTFPKILADWGEEFITIGGYNDLQASLYNISYNANNKYEICEACDG